MSKTFALLGIAKKKKITTITFCNFSIKFLPSMIFENLNSLETLNVQNNKLSHIPQDIMEPITDTLRIIDITGKLWCIVIELTA